MFFFFLILVIALSLQTGLKISLFAKLKHCNTITQIQTHYDVLLLLL